MKNTYLIQSIIIAVSIIIIGCSGGSGSSGSSGSEQTITPTVESIHIETNGDISDLLDGITGITGITIETDENGNLTTFTSGVTASYDDEFTIITIESNASRTIIKLTGGDAENRMVSKNESLNINNKGEQYILTSTIVDSLKTIVRAIDEDNNNYFCTELSYIPVIAQEYLQELPLHVNHCLGKDIELTGNFEPIGYPDYDITGDISYSAPRLNAIFDGNNKKIIGLTINKPNADFIGLFGYIGESGEVRQLTIEDPNVIGNNHVGALAGYIIGPSIENVTIEDPNVLGNLYVGALAGYISIIYVDEGIYNGRIEDITIEDPNVNGNSNVGALAGRNDRVSIENVTIEDPNVTGNNSVGALVGANYSGSIVNVTIEEPNVIGNHNRVGALVGGNFGDGIIENITIRGGFDSTKTSKVQGNEDVGGIVGFFGSSSTLALKNSRVVSGVYNFKIRGNINVGGLVGNINRGSIESSYTSIDVEPIDDATGDSIFGGLVGISKRGKIINSYSTGSVKGTDSVGDTFGGGRIGGLVGNVVVTSAGESQIKNSYSTGEVSYNGTNIENIGGFIGHINNGNIAPDLGNNYFSTETSGQSDGIGSGEEEGVTGVTGITATEIVSGGSKPFIDNNWDFDTVWSALGDGEWPILKWQEQADQ